MSQLSPDTGLTGPALGDTDLCAFVEAAAVKRMGNNSRVSRIERKLYDYHSSFAIEELVVVFENGTRLPLIFKNLSADGLLAYARQIRPQFSYHPTREIAVYQEILAGADLGTATCYGALIDPEARRYWLLLEKVVGDVLSKTGEFSIWCDVARWLADVHCRLAGVVERHPQAASLLSYDQEFYDVWIDRAEHFCGQRRFAAAEIAPQQMKWLADQCRLAVRYVCRLPPTFIHGEFYASNVLIKRCGNHVRICPIDWETAAIGSGLLDLAALVAGSWTEQQRIELAMAYYDALPSANRTYGDPDEFLTALRCCRLFTAIKWLGWSSDWQAPDEHQCDWLAEAMQLAPAIEADRK